MSVDRLKGKLEELAENREYPDLEALGGVEALATHLQTNSAEGLADSQVSANREKFGRNIMPDKPVKTLLQHFWESLDDLTLAILEVRAHVAVAGDSHSPPLNPHTLPHPLAGCRRCLHHLRRGHLQDQR